ncbi:isopentenyl-diphosphate Delta-isomerase [Leucobacter denitrificans]|uniref:Isopentenyl-diphosphate Delta-isomerase n=1 Tax=Leucobacter denitrificans TaxID=683042 RepID=A0A7G9S3W5_9MICO|nr:isopentenyl-diphosphate Delta-isomerase [Leucobacter denitrificans]QNN62540.1 isopentenyl-diphosphate Delta-isomerase [Leucobacter denitrificans]
MGQLLKEPDTVERVVLVDESGNPIGSEEKASVHTDSTPLHLAFSCYLFNEDGNVLVTRRALSKRTWPGVWTNSFCGHPQPGESTEDAVERRARQELGTTINNLRIVDPDFKYHATDASGIVENEICPVYEATISGTLAPHPGEVSEWQWIAPAALAKAAVLTPFAFSPWMVLQLPALAIARAVETTPSFGPGSVGRT